MCGEQETTAVYEDWQSGSPPRVRGTEACFCEKAGKWRITPACAGNSDRGGFGSTGIKDHPRVCGEQGHIAG